MQKDLASKHCVHVASVTQINIFHAFFSSTYKSEEKFRTSGQLFFLNAKGG